MSEGISTAGPKWTPEQHRGITTTGHSLLVSAAAGSGKTAMLAARCAHLVCDAPETCDVDELLVVTFTEAAAAEMKARIHAAIRDRVSAPNASDRLRRQLAIVDRASVSTLHGFCARLLREHFHAVGLDPAFSVLDGDEAALLRSETARELFDDRYELDPEGAFHCFVDAYGEGDDSRLIRRVIATYEMLRSVVDPAAWIARARERIAQGATGLLEETELGGELIRSIKRSIAETHGRCTRAIEFVRHLKHFPVYVEFLSEASSILRHWQKTLEQDGIDALAEELSGFQFPRLRPVATNLPNRDLARAAVASVRDAMTKGGWRDLLRFTSAQWQAGLAATQPHAEVFLGLVEEFGKRYRLAKEASRAVDFSDLERLALKVLCEGRLADQRPSAAARAYHAQFRHVLVDEYQDINEVQDAILRLLSRESVFDEGGVTNNLFCVGDVKQSIYRFRLAEAGRFLDRQKLFSADSKPRRGEVIPLQANFRSRATLLQAINSVFERLMTEAAVDIEYDQGHLLRAGLKFPETNGVPCFSGAPIEMHLLPEELAGEDKEESDPAADSELDRTEREALFVAQRIRQITGLDGSAPMCVMEKSPSGEMQPRPIKFSDIVILLRSIRYKSEQYAEALRRAGIPVHSQSGTGYFDSQEVRDMLALLSILDNQRQDIPLATVLRSPLASLAHAEDLLARIRHAYPPTIPFHDAVVSYAAEKTDASATELKAFLARVASWRALAHSRPLSDLMSAVFEQTGYLAFCAGLHDGAQRVANLLDLHKRASHFGSFQRQGLSRFMQFLESLRDEADLGQPSIASEADNVVRVMSVHRSKGLEFPVVVLPDLAKRINFTDCQGTILADRTAGLGLAVVDEERMIRYPSLASVLVQQRLRQQSLAEEMRVLYVAMTRAREHLILVGTAKANLPEYWSVRWGRHDSTFPPDAVLSAKCLLDWLGPAAAACAGAGREIIRIKSHSAAEVASWEASHPKRPALTDRQEGLANLQPIDPAPKLHPTAKSVIDRLEFQYPFAPFAKIAAVQTVTARGKEFASRAPREGQAVSGDLDRPRFMSEQSISPADIGSAAHLVLRHLEFARVCDAEDLDAQIGEMIERRQITSQQAGQVDRGGLLWLMSSELGPLLREHAGELRRELPVHFAAPVTDGTESDNPEDRVMVRGRIDLLIPASKGAILVDYKTDRISPEQLTLRASDYSAQLKQYQSAIEQIVNSPIAGAYLVFLTLRKLRRV